MTDFTHFSLFINLGLFVVAALFVWFAGTRLSRYADAISAKTGIGRAVMGLLLLAGVTSLPEIGVTVSSSAVGDTQLALNNLFGSIAMQVAVLAVIDLTIRNQALTSIVPEPVVMVQGSLNVLLLAFAGAAMIVGDIAVFGLGVWSTSCLAVYVGSVWIISQAERRHAWLPARDGQIDQELLDRQRARAEEREPGKDQSLRGLVTRTTIAAAVILIAGFVLSRSGSAIAEQTGLGSSFVGFVLVAISTSLPEFSSALSAARLGLYAMAISGILGTNLINVGLVFLIDLVSTGNPVLSQAGNFSIFGALLGLLVTALFMVGLSERRDRTVGRLGLDSLAVLIVYAGGVALLYTLRG